MSAACCSPRVAHVTSTVICSWPDAVTSRAVTMPPAFSIAVVSSLTAVGRACTSRRAVMDEETLGDDHLAIVPRSSRRVTRVPTPSRPLLRPARGRRRRRAGARRVRGAALARGLPAALARGACRGRAAGDPRVVRDRGRARAVVAGAVAGRPSGGDEPVVAGALRATALVEALHARPGRARRGRAAAAAASCSRACTPRRPAGWLSDDADVGRLRTDRAARGPHRSRARARRRRARRAASTCSAGPCGVDARAGARRRAPSCTASCSPCGRSRAGERGGRPGRGAAAADRARSRPDRFGGRRGRLGRGAATRTWARPRGSRPGPPTGWPRWMRGVRGDAVGAAEGAVARRRGSRRRTRVLRRRVARPASAVARMTNDGAPEGRRRQQPTGR